MTATASRQPAVSCAGEAAMDSVDSYVARVLSIVRPLPSRPLSLAEADGTVLAEDVWACCPLPCFDNSAMDGYAVAAFDVASATPAVPVILPVHAEIAAGDVELRQLTAGTCMRIMTGALLPADADAVVRVEWTDGGTERVAISAPVRAGDSVRRSGSDVGPGELLLAAGTRLGPAQLGLLAAAGRASVRARPRPGLTILSAGNELAEPGEPLIPGRSWESNSFMLAAAASRASCDVRRHRLVRDDRGDVLAAVREALTGADMPLRSQAGKRSFICGVLDQERGTVTPAPGRSTHQLTALARSNALIVVPEQVTALVAGTTVEVLELHR